MRRDASVQRARALVNETMREDDGHVLSADEVIVHRGHHPPDETIFDTPFSVGRK
jgi:hypothetical protein